MQKYAKYAQQKTALFVCLTLALTHLPSKTLQTIKTADQLKNRKKGFQVLELLL